MIVPVAFAAQNFNIGSSDQKDLHRLAVEIPVGGVGEDSYGGNGFLRHLLDNGWTILSAQSAGGANDNGAFMLIQYVMQAPEGWEPPKKSS